MGMSPMHGDGFEQVLSNGNGLAASTVSWATVRSKDVVGAIAGLCVPRQKAVRELNFYDVNPPACNRVETPFRHVSFAETVEMVEFDPAVHATFPPVIEYNASAPNMAYRAHAAPAPMVEYDAALMMVHRAHAALAPMVEYDAAPTVAHRVHAPPATAVEYDAPALTMEYQAHVAPAPVDEYDASAARAAPSPLVDGPVVSVVHVPQVQVVEKTIEIPQWQTRENRRYSRNPVCPKHPNFREFGHHHARVNTTPKMP